MAANDGIMFDGIMFDSLVALAEEEEVDSDSFFAAMKNWIPCMSAMGMRDRDIGRHLTLRRIQLRDAKDGAVSLGHFLAHPDRVHSIAVNWCNWKQNSSFRAYHSDHPDHIIENMHAIICRFENVIGIHHLDTPIAVYRENGKTHFIHEDKIRQLQLTLEQRVG